MSQERTFIAIKPDGVQRGLIGRIIQRFEDKGYQLVAMKLVTPTKELAAEHYSVLSAQVFFRALLDRFSSGPVCAMVWQGAGVVAAGRRLLGQTNPAECLPGTIRGDYGISTERNVCHASDAVKSAQREITLWFKEDEIQEWTPVSSSWIYA